MRADRLEANGPIGVRATDWGGLPLVLGKLPADRDDHRAEVRH